MKKLMLTTCKICNEEKTSRGFSQHIIKSHGTFWHPSHLREALSELQIGNYHNDNFKKELAKLNGYNLETVYDTELDNYINCFYTVFAERVDIDKLLVEYE